VTKSLLSTDMATGARKRSRALEIGRVLGRYVVVRPLGQGGSASVYAAFDSQIDRQVALKVLHDASGDDVDGDRRDEKRWSALMREARILGKLNHPNVVTLFDVEQIDDVAFIAMELVDGVDLRTWLSQADRSTDDILDAFCQAARGLEAAHAAGIVHGDFKPANVLIGTDGRVRVTDFGIARAMAGEGLSEETTLDTSSQAFVGTPYYAAPEQHDGAPATTLSDQYSFFLSLSDALSDGRALSGTTTAALALEKHGGVPPIPARTPRWLAPALERGLQPNPGARYPGFSEVLTSIEPPARSRAAWWVAGAAIAGSAALLAVNDGDPDPCEGAARHFDGVWSSAERTAITDSLTAANLEVADATAEVEALDEYVSEWVETQTESCRATQAGEQSEGLLDLRTHCLLGRRRAFEATLRVLQESSAEVRKAKAVGIAGRLPALSECSDIDRLQASAPDLSDPEYASVVDPVLDQIAEAEALERVGRFEDAFAVAAQAKAGAEDSGLASLQAQTLLHYGTLVAKLEGDDPAEELFALAYDQALAAGDDLIAIAAARNVLGILCSQRDRLREAHRWGEHARALVRRSGLRTELPAIELNDGHAYMEGGDEEAAKAAYQRGLDALEDTSDSKNQRRKPPLLSALGRVAARQGDLQAALDYQKRAMDLRVELATGSVESSGFDHHALGIIYGKLGQHDEAIEQMRQARDRFTVTYGPDHRYTLTVGQSLALAMERAGRTQDAAGVLRETCDRTREHDRPELARCLSNLASIVRGLGDLPAAAELAEEALALARAEEPANDESVAHRLLALAEIRRDQKKTAEALAAFVEAQRLASGGTTPGHPDLVQFEVGLGRMQRETGDPKNGLASIERALAAAAPDAVAPGVRAEVLFELALTLAAAGEDKRAHERANEALALLRERPPGTDELRANIASWLGN
jgi:serine/threonine-protein kinase